MSVASRRCHIGVDLGKKQNHSAIVVVEQLSLATGRKDPVSFQPVWERRMTVTHIEQLKLGVEYTAIVERLHALTHSRELEAEMFTICVDATGLGEVVMELLRQRGLRGELMPVVFTGGRTVGYAQGAYTVPKQELVQGVALHLEQGELSVAAGVREWGALKGELLSLRGVRNVGGMTYESAGKHDDLVMALGLACFGVRQRRVAGAVVGERRLFW